MTIGIYEGHAFLIKDITKLAKTYVCNNCRARFTQGTHLQRHAHKEEQLSTAQTRKSKPHKQLMREPFTMRGTPLN